MVEVFGEYSAGRGCVVGTPHESVPGLFRVFPASMAIYGRFPGLSTAPNSRTIFLRNP